jgi:hypothetical protein
MIKRIAKLINLIRIHGIEDLKDNFGQLNENVFEGGF